MPVASKGSAQAVVRAAEWPADHEAAASLLRSYAAFLESGPNGIAPIDASGLLRELSPLPEIYVEPHAVLLLAWVGTEAAGCVSVKALPERNHAHEVKRLWTEPRMRGSGAGRLLMEAAIAWARAHHAETLLLDTQPDAMPQALALYRSLGFVETGRYNSNPVPGLLFMELRLH